jgi:hypothetical protein
MAEHSSAFDRQKDPLSGDTRVWVRRSRPILEPMRDASCRGSPLTEHRRDVAPLILAPEADLATGHEAEE